MKFSRFTHGYITVTEDESYNGIRNPLLLKTSDFINIKKRTDTRQSVRDQTREFNLFTPATPEITDSRAALYMTNDQINNKFTRFHGKLCVSFPIMHGQPHLKI